MGREDRKRLLEFYKRKKQEIRKMLSGFSGLGKEGILKELVFCLCTPQSKALYCWEAVEELFEIRRLFKSHKEIEKILRKNGVRFPKKKSLYIVSAIKKFETIKQLLETKNNRKIRELLVKNIKGLGYKEASHFLRNIGYGKNIAILDRHILKNLKQLGVIETIPEALNPREYLEIEERMKQFCKELGIPMEEMDMLLWAKETGFVFK